MYKRRSERMRRLLLVKMVWSHLATLPVRNA